MSVPRSVTTMLQKYLTALESKDITTIDKLTTEHALLEMPMLKPNRLVGRTELHMGHSAIFENLESMSFAISNIEANQTHAIAEGQFEIIRKDTTRQTHRFSVVAESLHNELQRISFYCDARNIRPWSDKSIL